MSEPIAGGRLIAIPYRGTELGVELNHQLIEHLVQHPFWFPAGGDPDELRLAAVYAATNPEYWKWEIWNGGRFAGMLILSRVVPRVDAVFHFTLFPHQQSGVTLFSCRKLLWNFLGMAFRDFGLQRITVEVPEDKPKFANYLRQRLCFRYECELDLKRFEKIKTMLRPKYHEHEFAQTWVAAFGSRRERAHWTGTHWSDLMLLRLLRSEYDARDTLASPAQAARETTLPQVSDVVPASSAPVRD